MLNLIHNVHTSVNTILFRLGWVVYKHRAVKELGLLRVGLQVLLDPVQPIFMYLITGWRRPAAAPDG